MLIFAPGLSTLIKLSSVGTLCPCTGSRQYVLGWCSPVEEIVTRKDNLVEKIPRHQCSSSAPGVMNRCCCCLDWMEWLVKSGLKIGQCPVYEKTQLFCSNSIFKIQPLKSSLPALTWSIYVFFSSFSLSPTAHKHNSLKKCMYAKQIGQKCDS